MAKPQSEAAPEIATINDFELVRNSDGQWLLVLPDFPNPWTEDPGASLQAQLSGDDLILQDGRGRITLHSLIASHYAQALRADKPDHLLLCVVDDDGGRRLIRKIAFR